MNGAHVAIACLATLFLGYRYYSKFIAKKIYQTEDDYSLVPSEEFRDDVDFVPTPKYVLFGHHFSSIAGAAPILGPAIAVIWGWLPALLWIVLGTIFMGAVHDFGALVISAKHKAESMGSVAKSVINPRSRLLFLIIIFLLVFIVIAVFAFIIAHLFVEYPGSVIPINFQIIISILIGWWTHKKKGSLLIPSIIALVMLYGLMYVGLLYPVSLPEWMFIGGSAKMTWIVLLMIYGFIAATLPVWMLLQPRDFINSHQLIVGLGLIYLGIFVAQPEFDAPMFQVPTDSDPWFPYLFIFIACGALSGFHALVSSGTTSKQLGSYKDARLIGYGSMVGEATLAVAATIAVAAGFESSEAWHHHYENVAQAKKLGPKLEAFVNGTSSFIDSLGINMVIESNGQTASLAAVFISVLVISFAATSLDTAVRIQRYIIGEIGGALKIPSIKNNRFVQAALAVSFSFILIITGGSAGTGGLTLWPLFGSTNQLLGSLALLLISIWLFKLKRNYWFTLIPMIFITIITFIATTLNFISYMNADEPKWLLVAIAFFIGVCQVWIIIEGILVFKKGAK
ncbi:MAG: carbon starvation protein A [Flavobacteriales bacterium]|nr:carbon starvation protein A [Flavobacteriales bacterium]